MLKRNCKVALNLVHEYYGDSKLKWKDVQSMKLVDFKHIAKSHSVNIMLYVSKKGSRKDAGCTWQSAYSKFQYKSGLATINMGLLGGYCFYIKNMDILCKRQERKGCKRFSQN